MLARCQACNCSVLFSYNCVSNSMWYILVAQMVKPLPAMWETWVWSLGREDPLEKAMAIHSSTLAWKIPLMEEPDRLQGYSSWGHKKSDTTQRLHFHSKKSFWNLVRITKFTYSKTKLQSSISDLSDFNTCTLLNTTKNTSKYKTTWLSNDLLGKEISNFRKETYKEI